MALIKCKECEKEISDKAPKCVYCGCPIIKEYRQNNNLHIWLIVCSIIFLIMMIFFFLLYGFVVSPFLIDGLTNKYTITTFLLMIFYVIYWKSGKSITSIIVVSILTLISVILPTPINIETSYIINGNITIRVSQVLNILYYGFVVSSMIITILLSAKKKGSK